MVHPAEELDRTELKPVETTAIETAESNKAGRLARRNQIQFRSLEHAGPCVSENPAFEAEIAHTVFEDRLDVVDAVALAVHREAVPRNFHRTNGVSAQPETASDVFADPGDAYLSQAVAGSVGAKTAALGISVGKNSAIPAHVATQKR